MDAERARHAVRAWLAESWDPDLTLAVWWQRFGESGWAFPHWPATWFGQGLDAVGVKAVAEEVAAAGVIGPPNSFGQGMGAPTIIDRATDEQRGRWLGPLATGQEAWCQFFSEPGAGSDLAGLRTRAERDGDEWVINGQKVWTSFAHRSSRGMLLARTNPDQPKHRGITYFIIDVEQPGIEVRPLRQMNGESEFNEVFFTDARVPHANVVGAVDDGWSVTMTTLSHERASIGSGSLAPALTLHAGTRTGFLDRTVGELLEEHLRATADAPEKVRRGSATSIRLARERGKTADPVIRQRIVALFTMEETMRLNSLRARAAAEAGHPPGPEGSTAKLAAGNLAHASREVDLAILGAAGTLYDEASPTFGVVRNAISAHEISVGGGTDQIQRNIIAERVLGLPREPRTDTELPFRDLPS